MHQPEAHRQPGRPRGEGAGDRRRAMHGAGRAWTGTQCSGGVHAVARIQLRGRDPDQRKAGEGRLLHLHPHRGVRDRGARHQAGAGGDHARHSQRQRARAARPGRFGDHPHRRQRRAQRHSGGQGDAQGRDPVDAGREAAARHLRREGGRRARRIADLPSGHRGDDRGRAHLQPQGTGEGRARQADRAGADREAGAQPGRRDPHSDRRAAEAAGRDSGRAGGAQRPARRAHQQEAALEGRHSQPRHHRADQHTQPQAHSLCGQGPAGERADRRDRGDDLAARSMCCARSPTTRSARCRRATSFRPASSRW